MSESRSNKKYESFAIPEQLRFQKSGGSQSLSKEKANSSVSLDEGSFYVIDYEATNITGTGKFVLQSQKIEPPAKDEIRDLFHSMRDISRANFTSYFGNNRFFDKRVQREKAIIFHKQGMFMKDFTDSYNETAEFKEYFPCYQMMSYEQLRTYFTWRTKVRNGNVTNISLSYAFLYLYELLNNIGVEDPQDGLHKLMAFWKGYRVYNKTIDKYVLRWLKDYHIYYQMPMSFKEFVEENNLSDHYPKLADPGDNFDLFCAVSKYDIRSSKFFADDNIQLITDCFYFVINKLRQVFDEHNICFDESIFQPTKKMNVWQPFKDALFHHLIKQSDRRIVLSENEIYICSQNNWAFNTVITSESGKQLVGYIMKQIESVLRTITKYKYKLNANISNVTHEVVEKLNAAGLSLEKIITSTVREFYKEATKTVVQVDHMALSRIRLEALETQEKLIVEEPEKVFAPDIIPDNPPLDSSMDMEVIAEQADVFTTMSEAWESLKNAFTDIEIQALLVILMEETDIKKYSDNHGIMLEVLIDGINEKAMDFIGDNLLDDEFKIYDDYINQVKETVQ
ncbi:MAG: TerB N-terminal domain-containing protein [Clostridia bacterium]|nr:TerB N-terminal domain-containing protein [Clostridia bacterium]